jgi:ubiquitin carboxyl-terminal hydrolase 10
MLPPVLVLNLLRYESSKDVSEAKTIIRTCMQLSPELNIPLGSSFSLIRSGLRLTPPSIDVMAPTAPPPAQPPRYTLYGVLYHHGESLNSGHYTVDVLHRNRHGIEEWLHINDRNVSAVQLKEVFRLSNERTDDRCAYLLFYRRAAPA